MKVRTFHLETWGCQMNHHDSERLTGELCDAGLFPVDDPRNADIVLLNTCSVREKPVQKLLSRIGELERGDRSGPLIGICGCVGQHAADQLMRRSSAVAFVLGPRRVGSVRDAIAAVEQGRRPVLTELRGSVDYDFTTVAPASSTRGMITIIEGCDQFCSFCIVPYTRGRERSRPLARIVEQTRHLAASGVREVELLGQTVNAYRCPETGADLAALLETLAAEPVPEWIRFLTSHPRHFDDRLIDVLGRHQRLSRYLHLPFQAGADRTLERMNRGYTRGEYLDLVRRIRASAGPLNLSTDVIVGFPGESDGEFRQTLDLLKQIRFGQVFAFAYSERPRTRAARRLADDIPLSVKKERLHQVFDVAETISLELNQELVGTVVDVLIDGRSRRSEAQWQGRGLDNRVVNFDQLGDESVGDLVRVEVTRASPHALGGRIVGPAGSPSTVAPTIDRARP